MKATPEQPSRAGDDFAAGRTVLVGLIGRGIQQSRAPAMHEAAGRHHGVRLIYQLLDTDLMTANPPSLGELLRFAEYLGFRGFNVTHPYKQDVIAQLDDLADDAETVGAVNTVILENGRRVGHNTDLWGFQESFRRNMAGAARDKVLLLGAGGAGVAVAPALLQCGVERLFISDTRAEMAQELASRLALRFGASRVSATEGIAAAVASADGIVNATPLGMAKLPGMPIAPELLRPSMWVADIIYFPLETELLRFAREKGCRTLSGEGMAVYQAVRAFELFTGFAPDSERMQAAFAAFDR